MIDPVSAFALLLACEVQGGYIGNRWFGQPFSAQVAVMQVVMHRMEDRDGEYYLYDLLSEPKQFCLRKTNLDDPLLYEYRRTARMFLQNRMMEYRVPDLTGCRAKFFTSTDKPPMRDGKLCSRLGDMRFWR